MKRGALFTLLLLLVCAGIELYLLTVLNEYSYKKQYVEQHSEDIQLLILGHSHVANGINPKLLILEPSICQIKAGLLTMMRFWQNVTFLN